MLPARIPRHVGRTAEASIPACLIRPRLAVAVRRRPARCRRAGTRAPAAAAPRHLPAGAGRAGGGRPHADRFRLAPEHQRDAALGVELHDLVGALVDRPDVVLRIDAQAERGVEAVDVLAPLAHELAAGVELEQARAVAVERAVVAERGVGMPGARVDEDLALRIGADAADFADEDVVRASSADRPRCRTRARARRACATSETPPATRMPAATVP